jgi:hypothetical protein
MLVLGRITKRICRVWDEAGMKGQVLRIWIVAGFGWSGVEEWWKAIDFWRA